MGALPELTDRVRRVLEPRKEILEAYLFGSQARGQLHAHSDVDVAIYLNRANRAPSSWGEGLDIAADLMRALGRDDVDLVVLNGAPPMLYQRVLRDGVRIFSRDLGATAVREGRALSRCDWLPTQRRIDETLSRVFRTMGGE
jgi:hypothetical protein